MTMPPESIDDDSSTRGVAYVQVMLARLEGKLDALIGQLRKHESTVDDHERRLRSVEAALHGLATRTDIEEIEKKRDQQSEERQRKAMQLAALFIALVVPIEAAIIAWIIQGTNL